MRHLILTLALAATPVAAQEGDVEEGVDLLSRGAEALLRGLFDEIEPALRELRDTIDGLDAYEAPQMLPNGDIIIRRKEPLTPDDEAEIPEGGIEL